ncbi:MAG: hypothetical protein JWR26_272 [Pedosphaera sp.]|nr:hypothetical protein [Pedosphaera sp.]
MSSEDPYFQFPLCALSFGKNEGERLMHIVSYSVFEAGRSFWKALDEEKRVEKRLAALAHPPVNVSFDPNNDLHIAAQMGAKAMNITSRDYIAAQNRHQTLEQFRVNFEAVHGRDTTVRIKAQFLWDAKDAGRMNYREFCFLCAVYSCIGANHGPVRVFRESIRARSLGYKSPKIMKIEYPTRSDGAEIPTEWGVRSMMNKLHELGFFSRCHPSRRQTFVSNKLSDEELRAAVLKRKTYAAEFRAKKREKDLELSQTIKAITPSTIIEPRTTTIIEPYGRSRNAPKNHQQGSNGSPTPLQEPSTIIKTPLIQTPAIETHSIETHKHGAGAVRVEEMENQISNQQSPKAKLQPPRVLDCHTAKTAPLMSNPAKPASLEEVQQFAAHCIKGSSEYAAEFWAMIEADTIGGDWKREFIQFSMKRIGQRNQSRSTTQQ